MTTEKMDKAYEDAKKTTLICSVCRQTLNGDGHREVLHCPDADLEEVESAAVDSDPIACEEE